MGYDPDDNLAQGADSELDGDLSLEEALRWEA